MASLIVLPEPIFCAIKQSRYKPPSSGFKRRRFSPARKGTDKLIMKIGLVQNKAIAGDFSGNLRRVVQGCRACMDAGAELLVASAQALDGAFPGALTERSSFLLQAQAALKALSAEINRPLIIASYAAPPHKSPALPRPYLLHSGEVQQLSNHSCTQVNGLSLFIDIGPDLQAPPAATSAQGILHLPTDEWLPRQWEKQLAQIPVEAAEHSCDVLLVRGVGHSMGQLQAGGSMAASGHGKGCMYLPLFSEAESVWNPDARHSAPAPQPTLLQAAVFSLRELLQESGREAYAVPLDEPHGDLLYALACAAVGAQQTLGLTMSAPGSYKHPHKVTRITGTPQLKLTRRQRAALLYDYAEEHDLLLLNPHSRNDFLLGRCTAPATLFGTFAPLGGLADTEIAQLRAELAKHHPHLQHNSLTTLHAAQEEELELLLQGCSPAEIIARRGGDEYQLHRTLRLLTQAAQENSTRPPYLHIHAAVSQLPPHHRLSET